MSKVKRFLSDSPADQDNLGTCKKTAESLLSFGLDAEGISHPFIIGLFGPWGSGKSSVLKLLEGEAKDSDKVVTVQIDAWKKSKDSFLRDFLRGITNKLNAEGIIKDGSKTDEKRGLIDRITKKKIKQKTTWNLNSFEKWVLRALVIFLFLIPLAWLLAKWNDWLVVLTYFKDMPSWVIQSAVIGAITLIVHQVATLGKVQDTSTSEPMDVSDPFKFRAIFLDLVGAVSNEGKHLCISIDNLDRCEPDEAIEIMRRIKTFMVDDKGELPVTFIIACDDEALESHLRQCFKQERTAAKEFLRKFFNISLRIPGIHPSDMHEFIDTQLNVIFLNNSLISITSDQKKHLRNIIYAAFAKTPRQVKQFINELAAKLYLLKGIEKEKILSAVVPTKHSETVALYLAVCNVTEKRGFAALDILATAKFNNVVGHSKKFNSSDESLKKLHDLHLHSKIDRTLWAAIEQMKDPSNRQRWGHFADIYHAVEVGYSRDFKAGLDNVLPKERHELVEDLFSECAYLNNEDARRNLVRFILNIQVAESIEAHRSIAAQLITVIQKIDSKIGWVEWNGKALAYYLKGHKDLLRRFMDHIIRREQISDDSFNIKILSDFLSEVIEVADSSQLADIWTRSLEHVPDAIKLMTKRPGSVRSEHIQNFASLWLSNLRYADSLMRNKKLSSSVKKNLIESALGWSFEELLTDPNELKVFIDTGGSEFISTLVQLLPEIEEPDVTHLQMAVTSLIQHLANVPDETVKSNVLDLLGLMLNAEAKHSVQIFEANSKANFSNILWNEISIISPEKLIKLFEQRPILIDELPQPNKPSLAIRSLELYQHMMIHDAIPNDWYTTLIEQTYPGQNMFGQWLDKYWEALDEESKIKIQAYVFQRVQQQPAIIQSESPQLSMYLKKMPPNDSEELLRLRYEFISQYYAYLITPNQINTVAGLESLLSIIDEWSGMKGKCSEQLKQIIQSARDVVPHPDLSSHGKGLKSKWGKAIKRMEKEEEANKD